MDRSDWDARYAAARGGLFGDEPNAHLRAAVSRPELRADDALVLADGDGRNGRWLAARGLRVTALDFSAEATRRARAADAAAGVAVERIEADMTEWTVPPGRRWGLTALIYLQGPASLRLAGLRRAVEGLAPGGWLAIEGFAAGGPEPPATGPRDDAKRWRAEEIEPLLAGLEVVELLTGRLLLSEGDLHRGDAWALRVLARLRA